MPQRRRPSDSVRAPRTPCPAVAVIWLVARLLRASPDADDGFVRAVRECTDELASFSTRVVGTPEHDTAAARVLAQVRALTNVAHWVHEFETVVPSVSDAYVEVQGTPAGRHRVFPLWPAVARLHTTPAEGFRGRPVYVGEARAHEVPAASLQGQIAVMEMTGGARWKTAHNAGAVAILLLGSPEVTQYHAHAHLADVPINVPRFYVPPGALADALRHGDVRELLLKASAAWTRCTARNVYALVRPRAGPPEQALAIAAPIDAMGIVPECSPGADAAVDAAFCLQLLRRFAASPPARPVLFAFLDAYGVNQLGMRRFLAALGGSREEQADNLKTDRLERRDYARHEALAAQLGDDLSSLDLLHENRFKDLHRYVKDEVARQVVAIEYDLARLRLDVHCLRGEARQEAEARIARLAETRARLNGTQALLLTDRPIKPALAALASDLWRRARSRIVGQRRDLDAVLARHERNAALRTEILRALGLPEQHPRPVGFLLATDVSDAGVAVGPSLLCAHLDHNETSNSRTFRDWLNAVVGAERDLLWPGEQARAVNLDPFEGLDAAASHAVGPVSNPTSPAESYGLHALTWSTLDGYRLRVDTPNDAARNLDWNRLTPQIAATRSLIERLCRHTDFRMTERGTTAERWRSVRGVIVERSIGEPVPRLPMPGYLTTLIPGVTGGGNGRGSVRARRQAAGVRLNEYVFTGVDGKFRFEDIPAIVATGDSNTSRTGNLYTEWFVQSYDFRPDGAIARAVDLNRVGKGVRLDVNIRQKPQPLRAVVFTCEEMSAVDLLDSRYLSTPSPQSSSIVDAVRGGKPQRMNFLLSQDLLSVMLEPGTRWMLILRLGTTQNRMALLNMADEPAARDQPLREAIRGRRVEDSLPVWPVLAAARDYYALNERRLADYRSAGIRSQPIERIRADSRKGLDEAAEAVRRDDGAGLQRAAMGAMASEVRAYQAVRGLANDVARAAIFLLLVLVPFSFAFERLVFACAHVYRQIAVTLVVFSVMTAILWSFHPAFRISSQPLIIVMAFAIIFMSLLVMSVVYSRFKAGIEELHSGKAETSGARSSGVGIAASAIILGIANMRKRPLRTTLTGVTIVLITFAILCFTSVSSYVDRREYGLDGRSPYPGLLVRLPATRPLPPALLPYLETLFPNGSVVPRYWWVHHHNRQWRVHVRNPATGRQRSLKAAVGLHPAESELVGIERFLPNWREFSDRGGCYLDTQTAAELGAKPGDTLFVLGRDLTLLGTFDGTRLGAEPLSLDGQSLFPFDYSIIDDEQRNNLTSTDFSVLSAQVEEAGAIGPELPLPCVHGASLVIVRADTLRESGASASLRSVAVRTANATDARTRAYEVARRLAVPVYFGSADGINVVAATPLKPVAPKGLIPPIAVASLIIFNTMLSSIAERKREIHVYTSLGLAPLHVGALFLAEAVTYGLMGSIFGYIIGQAAATLINHFGWLGGITLNYSGTQAVVTMGTVLLVVIVSAIIPAVVAGRIASPSHEMSWRVPAPVDDLIRDVLPFTTTAAAANGVMRFLYDYIEAHREGSIGAFTTDNLRVRRSPDAEGSLMTLLATVWLAPYDLGVRQEVEIRPRPTGDSDICEIDVALRRGSGQTRNWWRLNRVFLSGLRRQLLGWRSLRPERMLRYIAEAGELRSVPS